MSKQNQPTGYYDPQTGTFIPTVKKKKKWPWIVAAVVLVVIIGAGAGGNKSKPETAPTSEDKTAQTSEKTVSETPTGTDASPAENAEAEPDAPDFSDVPTEYTLTAGQYYAGIDIPCGKFNIELVSGHGNLSTSNIYSGGLNEIFGTPDENHSYYETAYNGVKLPEGERINVQDSLVIKITYTRIDAGFSGRTEDKDNTITLIQGNYDIGIDIPAGLYTVRVIEGHGNVAYNVYGGGLNEIMGEPGTEDEGLGRIPEFKNAWFPAGDELTIRGMTVELIPMIPGYDG